MAVELSWRTVVCQVAATEAGYSIWSPSCQSRTLSFSFSQISRYSEKEI